MATIQEALQAALQRHQTGLLAEAETIYRQILGVDPQNAVTLNLLGTVCLQQKRLPEAIQHLTASTELVLDASAFNNLGGAYLAANQLDPAEAAFRKALELSSDIAKYHFDLGTCLKQKSVPDEAVTCFEAAIRLKPDFIQAMNNLGTTLTALGVPGEAVEVFRRALSIKPDYSNARNGLGNALLDLGNTQDALTALSQSVQLSPKEPRFHSNLGVAQKAAGHPELALASYRTAIQLNPNFLEARRNLGNLFVSQQMPTEAAKEFESAAELNPDDFALRLSIGDCYRDIGELETAKANYATAASLQPHNPWLERRGQLICPSIAQSTAQIDEYRNSLLQQLRQWTSEPAAIPLSDIEAVGVMPPFSLTYHGRSDRPIKEAIAQLYLPSFDLAAGHEQHLPADKPRIGFFVTNGHEGIFLRCMAGILQRLNRSEFAVTVLAPAAAMSAIRADLINTATTFVTLPDRFAPMISVMQQVQLDVLYYWECGTDLFNYFLPFAKLAPVQCTGWGLPSTSGIPAMNYYLSSLAVEPENAVQQYSETLIQTDSLLTWQECIEVPSDTKTKADFGFSPADHVYLCAQNLMKFHPDFDEILAGILRQDEAAVIAIVESRHTCQTTSLKNRFARFMPDEHNRIRFVPRLEFHDYLQLVTVADVALDPLHYGSGITAYEILAAGTPLITLPTEFRRGRFVVACYQTMGFSNCIARDQTDYIRLACEYASSPDRRKNFAREVSERIDVLFEDSTAVSKFESALTTMLSPM